MSDRDALIAAIRAHPDEDTPRLVYADWLDEFGAGDRDAATAEFIRLSCVTGRSRGRMPSEAYVWLIKNWPRLVPAALAATVPMPNASRYLRGWAFRWHNGRKKHVDVNLVVKDGTDPRLYAVVFDFHRGFLARIQTWSPVSLAILKPHLLTDQPLFTT